MKKLIIGIATLASLLSMSQGAEANIKVGYDFFRNSTIIRIDQMDVLSVNNIPYKRGFTLGLEILPLTFKDSKIKLGAGVEYNFGETTVHYSKDETTLQNASDTSKYFVPLYATAKFTYYRHQKSDVNLYTFARLGYAFSKENYDMAAGVIDANGVYYGLGFGIDYKYFLAEILYDGNFSEREEQHNFVSFHKPSDPAVDANVNDFHHKVGIRLGLQLGTQHFKKPQIITECPKCEPMVVEKIVEVPQIVEVEKIVEKIIEVEKKPEIKKPVAKKKVVKKKAVKRKTKNTNKKSDSIRVCRWVTIYKK